MVHGLDAGERPSGELSCVRLGLRALRSADSVHDADAGPGAHERPQRRHQDQPMSRTQRRLYGRGQSPVHRRPERRRPFTGRAAWLGIAFACTLGAALAIALLA